MSTVPVPAAGMTAAPDDAVDAVAIALDEAITEFVDLRVTDNGYEADARVAARIAVEALLTAGWRPPAADDQTNRR